jgi:hypothetical protein
LGIADSSAASASEGNGLNCITVRSALLDATQQLGENEAEESRVGVQRAPRQKVSSTMEVPRKGPVYKMRLIAELNQTPDHLPLDRLRRVQVGFTTSYVKDRFLLLCFRVNHSRERFDFK